VAAGRRHLAAELVAVVVVAEAVDWTTCSCWAPRTGAD
jgi:hypothetical protein